MPSSIRHRVSLSALIIFSVFALSGFGCRRDSSDPSVNFSGELVVWGLWQESADIQPVIDTFKKKTGVNVVYKKIASVADYEKILLEAIAGGQGPDVFVINSAWVEDKQRLLSPAPADTADPRAVQENFVDVVAQEVIRNGQVYALPTSVDTLAMYYNKDLLGAAGIASAPSTWTQFQQTVEKLTRVDRFGNIHQSGAAIGTSANVNRAGDILQLLMLQSGLPIYNSDKSSIDINNDVAQRALTFYTDFANKSKKVYTWNLQQDYSIDAFAEGETAIMFNYSYHLATIKAKNPRLNFAVAPMPQIGDTAESRRVNFSAFWPYAVSASSRAPKVAWQFLDFMTSSEMAAKINAGQQAPPARRDGVVQLQRDPQLGVFAESALTAKSWPRRDLAATDAIFSTLIDSVVSGSATEKAALNRAEDQLNQLRTQQ